MNRVYSFHIWIDGNLRIHQTNRDRERDLLVDIFNAYGVRYEERVYRRETSLIPL